MKNKAKPNIKPAENITPAAKQEQKGQNKIVLALAVLMLLALLISMMIPVYYVPLFNNISAKYGLSSDIARKLTLFDLALSSLGIETSNMAAAFKKYQIEYEPDVFYTSRFHTDSNDHLINAKEIYYHEYERTHKRPAEIAGIYQDGKEVNTPEIDGNLKGVRALPKDNSADFSLDDFTVKAPTQSSIKDEIMGSKRRQVRGSFDNEEQDQNKKSKREPLPDFASSIYDQGSNEGETQTLENSRMVKPLVQNQEFVVIKPENIISKLVGDSSYTDTFAAMTNFGGYGGALGYYIKDDLPKFNILEFFKSSGRQAFTSYLYSYTAVGREYDESSKHLAEIAFHGDEPQDEILVAKGQKKSKIPTMNPADMSPIELVLTVRHNVKECNEAGERYREEIAPLKTAYENYKTKLKNISSDKTNKAWRGAPGSCNPANIFGQNPSAATINLRTLWNQAVRDAKSKCVAIRNKERAYSEACKMDYMNDPSKDTCESIAALEVLGGTDWGDTSNGSCRGVINWNQNVHSHTFHGCGGHQEYGKVSVVDLVFPGPEERRRQAAARDDCVQKVKALFEVIDQNIQLEPKPGFVFVD